MGQMIDGQWQSEDAFPTDSKGKFIRPETSFRNRIEKGSKHPPEKDRYHLYISYACPWANRASIMRSLKKLKSIISMSSVDIVMGKNGWSFNNEKKNSSKDPLYDCNFLYEIYQKADPKYSGRVTVPILWDKTAQTIVNNESAEVLRILNSDFHEYSDNSIDYCPEHLREPIDEINEVILQNINNGVYKCGFAKTQEAYDEAFQKLFASMDKIEKRLTQNLFLTGETMTEADIRLFTTLIRFDAVYFGHFKCNHKHMSDYPHLFQYMKKIYAIAEVKETIKFDHIKKHYYGSHLHINPTGIVPAGPLLNL